MKTAKRSILINQAIEEFEKWLLNRQMSKESFIGYRVGMQQLNNWFSTTRNMPVLIEDITKDTVEAFVSYLENERKFKPVTVYKKIKVLSTFFECMESKKYIDKNPMEDLKRVKVPKSERTYLNKKEIEAIIEAIDHPVVHYFVMTMAYTGLRVNECIGLTLKDVDLIEGLIHVINGKGGKNRTVPVNNALTKELLSYLKNNRPLTDSPYFFALKRSGTISGQYVNRILKEATKKAGIEKHVTSHTLRHSFASYLIKDTNVAIIQRLLGHANLKTTSIYLHIETEDMKEAIESIDFKV